jgi:hypothetical protein
MRMALWGVEEGLKHRGECRVQSGVNLPMVTASEDSADGAGERSVAWQCEACQ